MVAPDLPINLPTSLAAIWVVKVADLDILLELVKEPSRAEQNENDEVRLTEASSRSRYFSELRCDFRIGLASKSF